MAGKESFNEYKVHLMKMTTKVETFQDSAGEMSRIGTISGAWSTTNKAVILRVRLQYISNTDIDLPMIQVHGWVSRKLEAADATGTFVSGLMERDMGALWWDIFKYTRRWLYITNWYGAISIMVSSLQNMSTVRYVVIWELRVMAYASMLTLWDCV